jgi:hypothetical protein
MLDLKLYFIPHIHLLFFKIAHCVEAFPPAGLHVKHPVSLKQKNIPFVGTSVLWVGTNAWQKCTNALYVGTNASQKSTNAPYVGTNAWQKCTNALYVGTNASQECTNAPFVGTNASQKCTSA